jgi:pimeloyl-ACP methyl ester carboxylesterase
MADRLVDLAVSPLAPGTSHVPIHVRDSGTGQALMFLHGGWGYGIYPFERQIDTLGPFCRIVIPDRTGYGRSGALDVQHPDFHRRAAEETFALLDALALDRVVLWGHSDGAVIALRMALMSAARVEAVIAEATHFYRRKPRSRLFFETMRDAPDQLGERVVSMLQEEHGKRWRALIAANGEAWLRIADGAPSDASDLYEGRLPEVAVPTLILHGAKDPRTEPGELVALCVALAGGSGPIPTGDAARRPQRLRENPRMELAIFDDGGHSPHSERSTADAVTVAAHSFLSDVARGLGPPTRADEPHRHSSAGGDLS